MLHAQIVQTESTEALCTLYARIVHTARTHPLCHLHERIVHTTLHTCIVHTARTQALCTLHARTVHTACTQCVGCTYVLCTLQARIVHAARTHCAHCRHALCTLQALYRSHPVLYEVYTVLASIAYDIQIHTPLPRILKAGFERWVHSPQAFHTFAFVLWAAAKFLECMCICELFSFVGMVNKSCPRELQTEAMCLHFRRLPTLDTLLKQWPGTDHHPCPKGVFISSQVVWLCLWVALPYKSCSNFFYNKKDLSVVVARNLKTT